VFEQVHKASVISTITKISFVGLFLWGRGMLETEPEPHTLVTAPPLSYIPDPVALTEHQMQKRCQEYFTLTSAK
jgi:hypothetical protein